MSAELTKSVDGLAVIGSRHAKRGIAVAAAAVATAAAGQAVAYWLSPGLELKAVHVPAEVLSQFANYADNGREFTTAIEIAMPNMKFLAMLIAAIGVVAAAVKAFTSGDMGKAAAALIPAIIMGVGINIVAALFPSDSESGDTARERFTALVERADVAALRLALADTKVASAAKDYVLAQAAMVQARTKGEPLASGAKTELTRQVGGIGSALQEGTKIDADPRTLYLLERQAIGAPKSAIAVQYQEEATRRDAWGKIIGPLGAAIGVSGLLIGGAMLGLGVYIGRRVKRLRALVSPSKTASA